MPNRLERINGVLTPKIAPAGVAAEDKAVLPDYSRTDDFNHPNTTAAALVYTVTGTYTSSATGGGKLVSGTVAGNSGGIRLLGASNQLDPTKKLRIKARVKLTNSITDKFAYIGTFETEPTDADPPVEAADAICFRAETGDTNWFAVTATTLGSVETAIDTSIAVDLNIYHDFEILLENSIATFKIDSVIVATTSLTLPVATTLVPTIKVTTGNTSAKGIECDVLSVINSRA